METIKMYIDEKEGTFLDKFTTNTQSRVLNSILRLAKPKDYIIEITLDVKGVQEIVNASRLKLSTVQRDIILMKESKILIRKKALLPHQKSYKYQVNPKFFEYDR